MSDLRRIVAILIGLGLGAAFFWAMTSPMRQGGKSGEGKTEKRPYSLLLISMDALRPDRVGCYGYAQAHTTTIDGLSARGVRFTRMYAQSPWTRPSLVSLLTSRYPSECGMGRAPGESMDEVLQRYVLTVPASAISLAQVAKEAGFATGAYMANPYMDPPLCEGVNRGFDRYWVGRTRDEEFAEVPCRAAGRWLQQNTGKSFFLWVHLLEPHSPYDPRTRPPAAPGSREELFRMTVAQQLRGQELQPSELELLRTLYDEEIAYADAQVGQLLAALEASGVADRTVICFFADHGEEFLEHGSLGHGQSLYQELLHVPCIIVAPKVLPQVVNEPRGLMDLAPTLAVLCGLRVPGEWLGLDLFSQQAAASPPPPVFGESLLYGREQKAVISGDWKIMCTMDQKYKAFDLATDPGEKKPLPADRAPADLKAVLASWATRMEEQARALRAQQTPRAPQMSEETRKALQSLGYVGH